jgi:hypothetical protein
VFIKPIVVRLVDSGKEAYIHETLLRSQSGFFENALKKEWKEGQERVIDLHEVQDRIFEIWVRWLYTGRFSLLEVLKKTGKINDSASQKEINAAMTSGSWSTWS